MRKKIRLSNIACLTLTLTLTQACKNSSNHIPTEYRRIITTFNRLEKNNEIKNNPILFTIVSGDIASYLAQETGACQFNEYGCVYFSRLNPYKSYDAATNEIIRQSYIFGKVSAHASPNGTIEIPRHFFRLIGKDDSKLACLISHELAHIIHHHDYQKTKELSEESKDKSESEKKLIEATISRKTELLADRKMHEFTIKAGYPANSCTNFLDFAHKASGEGSNTSSLDSHPGPTERIEALKYLPKKYNTDKMASKFKWSWVYDKEKNYILYTAK